MNMGTAAAIDLAEGLASQLEQMEDSATVDVAICPPFVYLRPLGLSWADTGGRGAGRGG